MDSNDLLLHDALDLRLGEAEVPIDPPDVAAFARPLRPYDDDPLADDDELHADRLLVACAALADGALALALPPGARYLPLDADGAWPIPAPSAEGWAAAEDLSLETWSIEPVSEAMIAVFPAGPRSGPRWRPLVIAAVSLPLLLGGAEVGAAPSVQRPKSASEAPASNTSTSAPAPAAEVAPPELPGEPLAAPEPEPAPVEDVEAVAVEGPAMAGPPERVLQAMRGQEITLGLDRGGRRRGRLVDVQPTSILFVDYENEGQIVEVSRSEILDLRGATPQTTTYGVPDPTLPRGTGSLVGGGIALGIGVPFFLSGVVIGGLCPSCVSITVPLVIPGIIGLAAGIPLLVRGTRRRRAYLESARRVARITPGFAPTRGGWTGALTLRF